MPGLNDFLFGQSSKTKKKELYTPEQMQFLRQLIGSLGGGEGGGGFLDYYKNLLGGEGGQGDFEAFAEPYRQQFQNETIPMLAERFAGIGGGQGGGMSGALSSSGFGQSLSSAGSNFNAQLAQLYAGLRQQAAGQMAGLAGTALGAQPYYLKQRQASPGLLQSALSSFAQGAGSAIGGGF
jgi:hypothetical protein